jgi:hypothetical protein
MGRRILIRQIRIFFLEFGIFFKAKLFLFVWFFFFVGLAYSKNLIKIFLKWKCGNGFKY